MVDYVLFVRIVQNNPLKLNCKNLHKLTCCHLVVSFSLGMRFVFLSV